MLEIRGLESGYAQGTVLHGVDFSLDRGQVVAILGRNGVGKTTLISTVMGMVPARRGSVLLDGREIVGQPPEVVSRAGIAVVPQGRRVFASLTVDEHLRLADGRGRQGPWNGKRIRELLPRLAERAGHRGFQLSGGEQQMLAIARALLLNPEVLLLDEPSEGLAPAIVRDVEGIIATVRDTGVSVVLVEQDLRLAFGVADEVAVMAKGTFAYRGETTAFRRDPVLAGRLLGVT